MADQKTLKRDDAVKRKQSIFDVLTHLQNRRTDIERQIVQLKELLDAWPDGPRAGEATKPKADLLAAVSTCLLEYEQLTGRKIREVAYAEGSVSVVCDSQ